jgi:hypothetical protein
MKIRPKPRPRKRKPRETELVLRLPKLLEDLDLATGTLRQSILDARGNLAAVDRTAMALWCYATGAASGWIMQGGAMMVSTAEES